MAADYLSKRQTLVQGPAAEPNAKLVALAVAFDQAWLEADVVLHADHFPRYVDETQAARLTGRGSAGWRVGFLHISRM